MWHNLNYSSLNRLEIKKNKSGSRWLQSLRTAAQTDISTYVDFDRCQFDTLSQLDFRWNHRKYTIFS